MLSSIPHDPAFTQLVITQIVTFYDKCFGWYKAIVAKVSRRADAGVKLKAAASYIEPGAIRDVVSELRAGSGNKSELIDKETDLLIKRTDEVPLEPYDIISDPKTVAALSLLYNSMVSSSHNSFNTQLTSSAMALEPPLQTPQNNSPLI